MNDTELDELLDAWKSPTPPESLRENLQAELATKQRRPRRKRITRWRLAAAAALIFAALLVIPDASSTKLPTYTVESETTFYGGRWTGWPNRMLMTSYNDQGDEVIVGWSFPEHGTKTVLLQSMMVVSDAHDRVYRTIRKVQNRYYAWRDNRPTPIDEPYAFVYAGDADAPFFIGTRADLLSSGCEKLDAGGDSEVLGREVILNYNTIVVRKRLLTLWMAPELSCFALRAEVHEEQPDGSRKLISERRALKVTVVP